MIDEDLYKIATDELNSGARKPDVWARACALASDDHDEARFLYTNLRVEEMLNKDGKQRTFSTSEQHRSASATNAAPLDTVEMEQAVSFGSELIDSDESDSELDSTVAQIDSSRTGSDSLKVADLNDTENGTGSGTEVDELDSFDVVETNSTTGASGTDFVSDKVVELDDETKAELAALSNDSSNDSNAVTRIAEKVNGKSENVGQVNASQVNESSVDSTEVVANVFRGSAASREQIVPKDKITANTVVAKPTTVDELNYQSPATNVNVSKIENEAVSISEDHDATANTAYADSAGTESANAANDDAASERQEMSTNTAPRAINVDQRRLVDEENSADTTLALDTGVGRSFMVFNRHGDVRAVKHGVSWPAMLFTFPWLLSKALFGTALVYGCLWLVSLGGLLASANRWFIAGADASINIKLWAGAFALLAIIGLLYIPFRYGNQWIAEKLQNRGFMFEGTVSAENNLDAADRVVQYNQENTH